MNQGFALPAPAQPGQLPGNLRGNPHLGQWLRITPEGKVMVSPGKVEIGQGILTALAQIVAEELEVGLNQITMVAANTGFSPNESVTSGSLSVQDSGRALQQVCAEVRAIYLAKAATHLGEPVASLQICNGLISGPSGAQTSYWDLADDALLDTDATGRVPPKPNTVYRKVGTSARRLDLPDKIFGKTRFIHDMELPGMLHGRMLRPNAPGATLLSLDDAAALACNGVISVVRDGSLLAIVATGNDEAEHAAAKLSAGAVWSQPNESLPDEQDFASWLRSEPADTSVTASPPSPASSSRTIKAQYAKPFLAHASIAPSCALAVYDGAILKVWSHSQGIFNLRSDLALAFAMEPEKIIVQHVEGAGCYGHNPADDVAFDAAWLARHTPGRPVRVQWSRADELAWAPFGPAMAIDLEADLDAAGTITGWRHSIWSNGHTSRPGRGSSPALLGAWHLATPFERSPAINPPLAGGGGAERNAIPGYEFPNWQVTSHRILNMPLRTSALRSLGAMANIFAVETFIDDLARAANTDPVEWRLRYLHDERARAVIALALEKSGWPQQNLIEGKGAGFAYARYKNSGAYCAVVAEIDAAEQIYARRLTIAVDVGLAINPDGVRNQIEGGAIQATSWALKEAVRFDRTRVTSTDWESYPILRFSEVPKISVHIVPSDHPPLGAGECSIGPVVAAIGNAVFDALHIRIRQLPITAERIMSELAQQP
ncbi:MAG: molybdopterin-dependent oxidoreductase [Acidocella sp.]|nr:molybdopterin-dependent oxidoreductase [Acidocella sp.]